MCIASESDTFKPADEALVAVAERRVIVELQNIPPSFMSRVQEQKLGAALATEPDDFEGGENEKIKGEVSMAQLANLKVISSVLNSNSEPGDFEMLIRHIVTGGQVVAESREKAYCRQFLLAISNLLPIGCIKLATYKEQYMPEYSTRFNLIGGPHNMDIPLEVSDVMVFRITPRDSVSVCDENTSLADCCIEVRRRPEKEGVKGAQPQIVSRYVDLLLDPDVKDTILETTLRSTREGWMSKAKICYQMKNQLPASDIFKHITGCSVEDRQVVLYWTAGLSNAYKQHVLTTIQQAKAATAAVSNNSTTH